MRTKKSIFIVNIILTFVFSFNLIFVSLVIAHEEDGIYYVPSLYEDGYDDYRQIELYYKLPGIESPDINNKIDKPTSNMHIYINGGSPNYDGSIVDAKVGDTGTLSFAGSLPGSAASIDIVGVQITNGGQQSQVFDTFSGGSSSNTAYAGSYPYSWGDVSFKFDKPGKWVFYGEVKGSISKSDIYEHWDDWSDNGSHTSPASENMIKIHTTKPGTYGDYTEMGVAWHFEKIVVNVSLAPTPTPTPTPTATTSTPTPTPTPPPTGSKPTLGIDASPKSVTIGQNYTVVDHCGFAAPATGIAQWTVSETFKAKGSSTETFLVTMKPITNPNEFFKSYTKNQEGEYTYYISKVVDNKGNSTDGTVSVTVKVEAAAPTPTPPPVNKPPVAIISSADEVMAGDDIDIDSDSYDPDGYITDYYWSAPQAQKPIIGFGSTTWFDTPGNVSVYHRVTDNHGATDSTSKTIKVLPPIPKAQIDVKGRLKENYKITVDSTKSVASKRYPIDHTKTKWVITAVSGCTDSDIKYLGGLIGMAQKDFLVKKAGRLKVTLTVTNTLGQSDTTYTLVDVAPNLPPVAQLIVPARSIREYTDGQGRRYGETTVYDTSYSPDGDRIYLRRYYCRYDSDNDGDFEDETLDMFYQGTAVEAIKRYYSDQGQGVGKARYDIEVEEDLMEQDAYGNYINTIPEFITAADIKRANTFYIK